MRGRGREGEGGGEAEGEGWMEGLRAKVGPSVIVGIRGERGTAAHHLAANKARCRPLQPPQRAAVHEAAVALVECHLGGGARAVAAD